MSTANGCGYGGAGDGPGVSPKRRRGSGERILPPSPNPQEVTTKRRMKMRKRGGGNSPSPLSASHGPSLTWWPLLPASGDLCQGVSVEMSSDGDRANDQAITVVRPHTIIF
jgi:hypothetical protein